MEELLSILQKIVDEGFVIKSPTFGGVCKYCGYKYTPNTRKYQHNNDCLYTTAAKTLRVYGDKKCL